jgi:YD repeat-containing protein
MNAYGQGTFTYTWDAAGRETAVTTATGKTTTLVYDALNRVIERDFANGAITTQAYDPAGNIQQITNNSPTAGLVSQLRYAYNNANQRIVQQESDNTVTAWTYDKKYQLINELRYIMGSGSVPGWDTLTVDQWANLTVDQWAAMPLDSSGKAGYPRQNAASTAWAPFRGRRVPFSTDGT